MDGADVVGMVGAVAVAWSVEVGWALVILVAVDCTGGAVVLPGAGVVDTVEAWGSKGGKAATPGLVVPDVGGMGSGGVCAA